MQEKLYPLKLYLRHPGHAWPLILSLALNLCMWIELLWYVRPQEELLFLHYNILFGVDFFGEWWKIFYIPAGGLFIIITNSLIGWILFQKDSFGSLLLQVFCVLCQALLLLETVLLVFLNG